MKRKTKLKLADVFLGITILSVLGLITWCLALAECKMTGEKTVVIGGNSVMCP